MPQKYRSQNEEETRQIGQTILEDVLLKKLSTDSAVVVALLGDLGAGKTQLTKGIASALGISHAELHSPTFALANEYEVTLQSGEHIRFNHLDAYRFENPDELLELGIEDYLYAPNSITIIEWAERVEKYLPPDTIRISIETVDESERLLTLIQ